MDKKQFEAILAKNNIARELRAGKDNLSISFIAECLKDIEDYVGQGNQPCVADILEDTDFAL
jgi:hypothetical protein